MVDSKAMAMKIQGHPGLVLLYQKVRKCAKDADWQVVATGLSSQILGDQRQRQENQRLVLSLVYIGRPFSKK